MSSTRITRHVHAPRPIVYRAFLDAHSVSKCGAQRADRRSGRVRDDAEM